MLETEEGKEPTAGRTVLVTGGSKGIGRALVELLFVDGVVGHRSVQRVVVVARDSHEVKYSLLPGLISQIEKFSRRATPGIMESVDQCVERV